MKPNQLIRHLNLSKYFLKFMNLNYLINTIIFKFIFIIK